MKYVERPTDEDELHEVPFIQKLKRTVKQVKADREMGANYMLFNLILQEEREAAREEGRAQGIEEGRIEGRTEALKELIQTKKKKGYSTEMIADLLEISIEDVDKWIEEQDL